MRYLVGNRVIFRILVPVLSDLCLIRAVVIRPVFLAILTQMPLAPGQYESVQGAFFVGPLQRALTTEMIYTTFLSVTKEVLGTPIPFSYWRHISMGFLNGLQDQQLSLSPIDVFETGCSIDLFDHLSAQAGYCSSFLPRSPRYSSFSMSDTESEVRSQASFSDNSLWPDDPRLDRDMPRVFSWAKDDSDHEDLYFLNTIDNDDDNNWEYQEEPSQIMNYDHSGDHSQFHEEVANEYDEGKEMVSD